ncbi:MAG: hypothetical protein WAL48_15735 [Xanthobacteraceae bacterium]
MDWTDAETWQKSLNMLKQYRGLKNMDPSAYYTNGFISVPKS